MTIRKKKIIIVSILVIVIVISFLGGGSFARYVTDVRGNAMAQIATWKFKVNGQTEEVYRIDLKSELVNGKIAPGTKGSFDIIVDATGTEVGVLYNIRFVNETNKPRNLKFMHNKKIYNSITELDEVLSDKISIEEENKIKIITINWEWKYETGNSKDEISKNDLIDTVDMQNISEYSGL